ncbi:MAG: glycosyltransferase [bacterium]
MDKIKILNVVSGMNNAGVENLIMTILRNIDLDKYQFDFVVHTSSECYFYPELKEMGCNIFVAPKFKIINSNSYKKWWKSFIDNTNYDYIHAHMTSTAGLYFKYAVKNNIKTIAHVHHTSNGSGLKGLIKSFYEKKCVKYADIKIACGKEAGEFLFKKNFQIIINGIDVEKYLFNENVRKDVRDNLSIKDELVVGHVGRFNKVKNHSFLIDIFYEYHKKNINSKLLLVGDGGLKNDIVKKIEELSIENSVIFTGIVDNVTDYLMAMDCFILPSLHEGLSIAIIEAQTTGLNILASNTVTNDVKIISNFSFLQLGRTEEWVNNISCSSNREDSYNIIKDSEFNITTVIEKFEQIYSK